MTSIVWWWSTPIALALTSALFYAEVPLLSKYVMVQLGATPTALLLGYAFVGIPLAVLLHFSGVVPISYGVASKAFVLVLGIGILTSAGFICMNRAVQIPEAPISLVIGLVALSPTLASMQKVFLRQVTISPVRLVGGCALVVIGGLILTTGKVRIVSPVVEPAIAEAQH
jgi:hypothetical protein